MRERERQKETQSTTWCANGRLCERLETLWPFILFGSVISVFDFAFYYLLLHMYVCILCQLSVCRLSESEANRARRLLVIKCSVLLLNQKPNARILFRTATKLTLPPLLLLRMALLLPLSPFAATTSTSSAVCVCLQVTNTKSTSSSRMCCRFFRFLLPTPRFPLTNTCTNAYIAYTFCPVLTHGVPLL